MSDIIVRPFNKEEVKDVAKIRVKGWQESYKGIVDDEYLQSLDIEKQTEKFSEFINNDNFVVAVKDKKVVGFCRFINNNSFSPELDDIDCELTAIYTHPDYKNIGIGTKMFNYVTNIFKEENKKRMIIWCLKDNHKSLGFYKHMGAVEEKTTKKIIGNKEYDEIGLIYSIE